MKLVIMTLINQLKLIKRSKCMIFSLLEISKMMRIDIKFLKIWIDPINLNQANKKEEFRTKREKL